MKYLILIACLVFVCAANAVELDAKFLHAINMVEASGKQGKIIGDNGRALGGYQIHKPFWQDAVAFDKTIGGQYSDVTNKAYAERVVTAYLNRYALDAIRKHDYKRLAFAFHRGDDNEQYWRRVQKYLK